MAARGSGGSGGSRGGSSRSGGSRSGSRGGGARARGGVGSPRPYQRSTRVGESMREVIAEALEDLDDERLQMVTVTGVDVDPDFAHGVVFYSALFTSSTAAQVEEAFEEHRVRLQAAVGSQIRLKRTPVLSFRPDPSVSEGIKIDDLIRRLPHEAADADAADASEDGGGSESPLA